MCRPRASATRWRRGRRDRRRRRRRSASLRQTYRRWRASAWRPVPARVSAWAPVMGSAWAPVWGRGGVGAASCERGQQQEQGCPCPDEARCGCGVHGHRPVRLGVYGWGVNAGEASQGCTGWGSGVRGSTGSPRTGPVRDASASLSMTTAAHPAGSPSPQPSPLREPLSNPIAHPKPRRCTPILTFPHQGGRDRTPPCTHLPQGYAKVPSRGDDRGMYGGMKTLHPPPQPPGALPAHSGFPPVRE